MLRKIKNPKYQLRILKFATRTYKTLPNVLDILRSKRARNIK